VIVAHGRLLLLSFDMTERPKRSTESISINHVAVFVRNLETVRMFYETYFGAKSNEQYHNPRTGLRTYFLRFAGGCCLEIMTRPDVNSEPSSDQTGWAHVALSLGSVFRQVEVGHLSASSSHRFAVSCLGAAEASTS
jgi:hypothetical protein